MNLVCFYLKILLVSIWPYSAETACNPTCVTGNGFCDPSNVCRCMPGWDGVDCGTDKDECASNNGGCQTVCTNTDGSFNCGCSTGYEVHPNGFACIDIDECVTGTDTCDAVSSTCRNTVGSFECDCNAGYEVSAPNTCIDIDECARGTDLCDDFCVNTIGSYVCYCLDESQLLLQDGVSCSTNCAVDSECNGPANGACLNGNCNCVPGRQGVDCAIDIDECTSINGGCQQKCTNLAGSFECSCDTGYSIDTVDPALCLDVNECTGANICHEDAHCINAVGNYQCECKAGYTGSGILCEAVRPPDMMKHAGTEQMRPFWTVAFHTFVILLVIPLQL